MIIEGKLKHDGDDIFFIADIDCTLFESSGDGWSDPINYTFDYIANVTDIHGAPFPGALDEIIKNHIEIEYYDTIFDHFENEAKQ